VQLDYELSALHLAERSDFDRQGCSSPRFERSFEKVAESKKCAMICHSSGSTGLPKPIYQQHFRLVSKLPRGAGIGDFVTLPWYHSLGNKLCINTMYWRKTVYMYTANVPMTSDSLVEVLRFAKPGVLHAVPYVIKLLSEKEEGIEAMKMCSEVVYTGSQCPDDLGNYLVERGVQLATMFGGYSLSSLPNNTQILTSMNSSEFGLLGTSMNRAPGDAAWNYIRIPPRIQAFVEFKPLNENTYETVFLPGHSTLSATNSDEPPGSFHSRDIFSPHPTIPNAWKYLGRLDDRVTLLNGEKVLPLPIEGRIRQDPNVKEAVVFGIGKAVPGLLVIRSDSAREFNGQRFIDSIWPAVQDGNAHAEAFSQISRELIIPLPAGTEYPMTDKGSMIRAQVYKKFEGQIEKAYNNLEESTTGTLELNVLELETYLMKVFESELDLKLPSPETDFFISGMDSLQAIQARRLILRHISLGKSGGKLPRNVVFECGNAKSLAERLFNIRMEIESQQASEDILDTMKLSIKDNSIFKPHESTGTTSPLEDSVVSSSLHTICSMLTDAFRY
jgi:hypothetical protein